MTQRDEQILAAELVQAVLIRLSAATPRLLMERITVLERENAALRAAMAMTNQEEPESNPLRAAEEAYEGESIRARLSHGRDHAADRS